MKHFDVVAYAIEGALYCPDHCDPSRGELDEGYATPVFAGDEGWQDHCCDTCVALAVEAGESPLTLGDSQ